MFVAAQQTTPPASTPPTFPSDQSSQQAPTPDRPSSTIPGSDNPASQTGSQTPSGAERSSDTGRSTTITGCISENTGTAAGYVLTDNSGNKYELKGSSDLASHVGQEVRVKGQLGSASDMSSSSSQTGSMSSGSQAGAATAAATPLNVQSIKKVADTCSSSPSAK